jgi:CBS domain containing-hemolysin-like protein
MDNNIKLKLAVIIVLLVFSGFFSSSETAFFSLNKVKLRRSNLRKALWFKYVLSLLKVPGTFLATVLIGNEIVNISISVLSAGLIYSLAKDIISARALPFCSLVVTLPALLLFGEIIPKTLAVKFPEKIARFNSYPLFLFSKAIAPLRYILNSVANIFIGLFIKDLSKHPGDSGHIDEDIFKSMVDMGSRNGTIEPDERDLIHRTFRLDDIKIFQIMTRREDIVALPMNKSEEDFMKIIETEKFSRYPVYEKSIDRITGFVHAKDLLRLRNNDLRKKDQTIRSIIRTPTIVLENRNALSVLLQFQKNNRHIGIVTDSAGKTVGIITMEDILEELFGDIKDETDIEDDINV